MKKIYDRSYHGVTITAANYREILDKEGRDAINFHTKHLRAYLKGKSEFTHGYQKDENGYTRTDKWGRPIPTMYRVQSTLRDITPKDIRRA